MLRLLSAAAFGLAAFLLCARVSMAQECLAPEKLRADLAEAIPGVALRELKDASAVSFLAGFNAVPPRSHVSADAVILASLPHAPQAVVLFFWRGCMVSRAVLPRATLDTLLASIEKEA